MKIEEILQLEVEKTIAKLRTKDVSIPEWEELKKMYEIKEHSIFDRVKRPAKEKKDGRIEEPTRIGLGLQKLAVKRLTQILFSIPVKRVYYYENENKTQKEIVKAIEKIYDKAKINALNKRRSTELYACCESATLWLLKKDENNKYGFNSQYKLRTKIFSPKFGDKLYPYFDETDDLIAFSIEYEVKEDDKKITYFETFTADKLIKWRREKESWEEVYNEKNIMGKIPIVYTSSGECLYEDVSHLVDDLELNLSNNGDVISYNAAPLLEVKGDLIGEEDKHESKRTIRVSDNGGVRYVSWEQSVEAVKFQIDSALKFFFMQLQLPDLSFENVKGMGVVSGESRKTLLTDAHLKAGDEMGMFEEMFEREFSIIKSYLKNMNKAWEIEIDNIDCSHIITPFIQEDEKSEIEILLKANGGNPLMSQRESIERFGYSDDVDKTMLEISKEEQGRATTDPFI
ncbi:MAG: phage portal protein [Bacteroidales bacterium]